MRTTDRRIILGLYRHGPHHDLLEAALELGVTALDTADNYSGFAAHRLLTKTAGSLLGRFDITTKIGFLPDGYDLSATRLYEAARRTVDDLGRIPDTLLLHNPELSPMSFTAASRALAGIRDEGLCHTWGVSTWNPRPLLGCQADRPDVLMVRAGLMVPAGVLDAAERLAGELRPGEVRGMAPFGGNARDPIWNAFDPSLFLVPGQESSRVQAALAVALHVPNVSSLAVGTTRTEHLAQLVAAAHLEVDPSTVSQYRALIRRKAAIATRASA